MSEATKLTLRPEGTAGVVRAYVEAEMYKVEPVRKLYYMGPMFRRERPQKGRMRQFHQIGAEALGRGDPFIDAEIILLLSDFLTAVGLSEPSLQINSLGDSECRPQYREKLLAFLKQHEESLCKIAGGASTAIHCGLWITKSPVVSAQRWMRPPYLIRFALTARSTFRRYSDYCGDPRSIHA